MTGPKSRVATDDYDGQQQSRDSGKPVLLDACCKAGGATRGYQQAGFYVVGVDIEPQPNYVGDEFIQADAMDVLAGDLSRYAAIHASPPCHDHSTVTGRNRKAEGTKGTGWMLNATLALLRPLTVPWVVENVGSADMSAGGAWFTLCGSSFGLNVQRHRRFASNVAVLAPPCAHHLQPPRFRSLDSRRGAGALARVVGVHGHLNYPGEKELREEAMGIDWMTTAELAQAIPPAYTEWIGDHLLQVIGAAA